MNEMEEMVAVRKFVAEVKPQALERVAALERRVDALRPSRRVDALAREKVPRLVLAMEEGCDSAECSRPACLNGISRVEEQQCCCSSEWVTTCGNVFAKREALENLPINLHITEKYGEYGLNKSAGLSLNKEFKKKKLIWETKSKLNL